MINSEIFLNPIEGKGTAPFSHIVDSISGKAQELIKSDTIGNTVFETFDLAFKAGFTLGRASKQAEIDLQKDLKATLKELDKHIKFDRKLS